MVLVDTRNSFESKTGNLAYIASCAARKTDGISIQAICESTPDLEIPLLEAIDNKSWVPFVDGDGVQIKLKVCKPSEQLGSVMHLDKFNTYIKCDMTGITATDLTVEAK